MLAIAIRQGARKTADLIINLAGYNRFVDTRSSDYNASQAEALEARFNALCQKMVALAMDKVNVAGCFGNSQTAGLATLPRQLRMHHLCQTIQTWFVAAIDEKCNLHRTLTNERGTVTRERVADSTQSSRGAKALHAEYQKQYQSLLTQLSGQAMCSPRDRSVRLACFTVSFLGEALSKKQWTKLNTSSLKFILAKMIYEQAEAMDIAKDEATDKAPALSTLYARTQAADLSASELNKHILAFVQGTHAAMMHSTLAYLQAYQESLGLNETSATRATETTYDGDGVETMSA